VREEESGAGMKRKSCAYVQRQERTIARLQSALAMYARSTAPPSVIARSSRA